MAKELLGYINAETKDDLIEAILDQLEEAGVFDGDEDEDIQRDPQK